MPTGLHNAIYPADLPCSHCPGKRKNVCKLLDRERQRELLDSGLRQHWQKREFLFRTGAPAGPIFKVTSGIVAVSRSLPDGRRQILDFVMPGELCGDLDADGAYSFDGEAVTAVGTCSFNRARFMAFVNRNRDVAEEFQRDLSARLQFMARHLGVVGQLSSTERVANFLVTMMELYDERHLQTHPLVLPMRRTDIADYLGLRLETVSRTFTRLKTKRIIDLDDEEVIVLDRPRLEELSSHDAKAVDRRQAAASQAA